MKKRKWYFYSYNYAYRDHHGQNITGTGNGAVCFNTNPNMRCWKQLSEKLCKQFHLPQNVLVINAYHPMTK